MPEIKNQVPYTFILTTWWEESDKLTYSQQHKAKHKSKLYGSPPSSNNISQQITDRFHIQGSSSSLGGLKQVLKEGYLTHTKKFVPIKHAKWQRTVGTRRFHHSDITNPIKTDYSSQTTTNTHLSGDLSTRAISSHGSQVPLLPNTNTITTRHPTPFSLHTKNTLKQPEVKQSIF